MTEGSWVEGEHDHIPYLHLFVCAPTVWRKVRGLVKRKRHVAELWAIRVQSHVRALHPKLRHPNYIYVNLASMEGYIRAVLAYCMTGTTNRELRILVFLLATHVKNRRTSLGQEGLKRLMEDAKILANENGAEIIHLSAEVDKNNQACQALLLKNGWEQTDQHVDGVHDLWAIRGALE